MASSVHLYSSIIPSTSFSSNCSFFRRQTTTSLLSNPKQKTTSFQSITATATTPSTSSLPPSSDQNLPIKSIPGDYGLPLLGALKDRYDYFYTTGGREQFFKSKMQKHQSTVFRSNLPPGPFISSDSRVIVLLDGKSFPILFDNTKVEKKDLFTGTYMPSTDLTGGYRILSYLDPSEPSHEKLKRLLFSLLRSTSSRVIPEFQSCFSECFDSLESELASKSEAGFNDLSDNASFKFLGRAWFDADPTADKAIGSNGPNIISIWVLFQLAPILSLGLPSFLEELTLHTFRLPPFLIKSQYNKLYNFIYRNSTSILEQAAETGISRDEACHNLVFATCFNSFGGMKILFPNLVKLISLSGKKLHSDLATEIRSAVKTHGDGKVTMSAIENMPLMKSVVYEVLRLDPPVPLQFAKAKRDFVIESHDAAFRVKKGEMLFGFQPFATKDAKIFGDTADEFVPDRFVGESGEELLNHVLWSNGPETLSPTVANKQCAGKDFVVLVGRLLVVELFLRYDTFEVEVKSSPLGASVTVKSLTRASS